MQEVDAERRIQILRGLKVDPLPTPTEERGHEGQGSRDGSGRERKRRRVAGEDDTYRDIRFAEENNALVPAKADLQLKSKKSSDAPITDVKGHINLFPVDGSRHHAPKNAEVEAEKAKKQKEFEDQYAMRFSNAAGFKQAVGQEPWYHSLGVEKKDDDQAPTKDVWGNEDPRRKEREKIRMASDDPLAAIKRGVAGVREVEKERKKWKEEKAWETRELEEAERRRERKRRRRRDEDDVERFSLEAPARDEDARRHRHRSGEGSSRYSHRYQSRSRDHDRHRSHHHRHRSPKEENRPGWEVGSGGRYSAQFAQA